MSTKDFTFEIKATDDDDEGSFTGLASPFGGPPDSYGDVVEPEAYAATLQKHHRSGTMPIMLWNHNPDEPIGVWKSFATDGKGLTGKGQLLLGVRRAQEIHLLMKAKAVTGLSIGYRAVHGEQDGPVYRLKEIDLFEVSVTPFPAAPRARVGAVKSEHFDVLRTRLLAGDLPTDREWEKGLREAFDLTRSQAEKAVRLCLKGTAQGEPGDHATEHMDDRGALALALFRDALKGFPALKERT
jgi:HK97 family phage prohead protease